MIEFSWRLVDRSGEIRLQERLRLQAAGDLWRKLAEIAEGLGRPGDILQVRDEAGDMIVRMGVATARSVAAPPL